MKRICGILTLAAGLALAGCETNGSMWNSASTDQPNRAFDNNSTMSNGQTARNNMQNPNTPTQNEANMQSVANGTAGPLDRQAQKNPSANLSVADRTFVSDAAASGMYEIQSSQMAETKSTNDRVKAIAQHMIDDHTKANLQLKNLALQKGFSLDSVGLTTDQHNMIDQLNKLSGTDFDREYLRQQQQAHQDTIAKFQTAASNANDRDLRDWAATTLPTLRQHLAMINNDMPNNVGTER